LWSGFGLEWTILETATLVVKAMAATKEMMELKSIVKRV